MHTHKTTHDQLKERYNTWWWHDWHCWRDIAVL